MSKSRNAVILAAALAGGSALAQDAPPAFRICTACHAIGEGAQNKIGPQLNDTVGRTAGGLAGYSYSPAMKQKGEEGLVWTAETLAAYLGDPRAVVPGTKMAFAGFRQDADLQAVIDYLAANSGGAAAAEAAAATSGGGSEAAGVAAPDAAPAAIPSSTREGGVYGLGREATPAEVAAWNVDVRPDGIGLPAGSGSVSDGDALFQEQCAACHGVFAEGVDRWPVLAGGQDTLTDDRPEKTIGSYWPFLSTVYDYIRRAMPYGNAHSLSDDEVYAVTAYLLYMNDLVEEDFVLSKDNFTSIRLPNEENFIGDTRDEEPEYADRGEEPCMENCMDGPAHIVMRARILDVTPGSVDDNENAGAGAVE